MSDCVYVYSFAEYIKAVEEIAKKFTHGSSYPGVLWFRGLDNDHPLIPSLYRKKELFKDDGNGYPKIRYAEDIRIQHYAAKNFHYFEKTPSSKMEWLEVMQHHSVSTRVLDWSESAIHSLIFAIEPFLKKDVSYEVKRKLAPCVWVLNPIELNAIVFGRIVNDKELIRKFCNELGVFAKNNLRRKKLIKKYVDFTKKLIDKTYIQENPHLNYIVNLGEIDKQIEVNRHRIKDMIEKDEFHLLFYILSRIYTDGIFLENHGIPPLAVVQPYHSERIKSQKGVFTVFPFYKEDECTIKLRENMIDVNAMQYDLESMRYLQRIRIANPQKIAKELIESGINVSWIYPELPIIANEIESHKVF